MNKDGYWIYWHDGAFPRYVGLDGEGIDKMGFQKFGEGEILDSGLPEDQDKAEDDEQDEKQTEDDDKD